MQIEFYTLEIRLRPQVAQALEIDCECNNLSVCEGIMKFVLFIKYTATEIAFWDR